MFGRSELGGMHGHHLHASVFATSFTVGKPQLGYVRYLNPATRMVTGVGACIAVNVLFPQWRRRATQGRTAPTFNGLQPASGLRRREQPLTAHADMH